LAMGGGGARLFTNRVAQIQATPVQAVQPIGWSLGSVQQPVRRPRKPGHCQIQSIINNQ
jgi:hypothetical protein